MKPRFYALMAMLLCTVTLAHGKSADKSTAPHKIAIEARRSAMNFDCIKASHAIRIIVEERTSGNIIVRAPQSVMPYVSLKVSDGTLRVSLLPGVPVPRRSNFAAEVYVPYNCKLEKIIASSAARVIIKPTIACDELELSASSSAVIEVKAGVRELSIDASGASQVKAEVVATELEADIVGASTAMLSGQATKSEIDLSGASRLHAANLRTSQLDLECWGASKASAQGIDCSAQASGASAVNIECLQRLNASASGASTIVYSGDCQVNIISNTGASSICKK